MESVNWILVAALVDDNIPSTLFCELIAFLQFCMIIFQEPNFFDKAEDFFFFNEWFPLRCFEMPVDRYTLENSTFYVDKWLKLL